MSPDRPAGTPAGPAGAGGQVILITGPVRSGKSRYGEQLAARLAGGGAVCYLATSRVRDAEMAARVAQHQAQRPAAWRTVEEPLHLADAVRAAAPHSAVLLVESLDAWVSNRLLDADPVSADSSQLDREQVQRLEEDVLAEAAALLETARRHAVTLILVTLEAGWGVVPPYPLGRAFRDLLGRLNATLAAGAGQVYLLVAGLPLDLKRQGASLP